MTVTAVPGNLFTDETSRPGRARRRLVVVGALVIVAVVAGAIASGAKTASAGYRTATVGNQAVDQLLRAVGTVEPVSQASVAFPVSGTVASVTVKVGDRVSSGDALATLDTASLEASLMQQEATLAEAQLALEKATASHDSASTATSSTSSGSTPSSGDTALTTAQQQVQAAQKQVASASAGLQQSLAAATAACGTSPSTTTTTTSTTSTTTTSTTVPGGGGASPCTGALSATGNALNAVTAAQKALADATTALEAAAGTGRSSASSSSSSSGAGSGGGSSSGPSGQSSAATSTAGLLAAQRSVDAASAHVAEAQQAVAQATIVSPIAGTVASVGLAVGDSVSAASATKNIVIVGDGGYEIHTTVSVDLLPKLAIGDAATVVPDGTTTALTGSVVAIGLTATSTSSYPVTVGLSDSGAALRNGSLTSVSIVLKAATNAVAVPTSAVHVTNGRYDVTVLDGKKTSTVSVEVGAVGSTWTQITSGVHAGQQVVLANLAEPLPSSATAAANANSNANTQNLGNLGRLFPGGTQTRRTGN